MTAEKKPRGPYRKSVERRERILDAALAVFTEHGDRGASLQEIADRVGVKQPSLLYYFPSREELLLAVLARRDTLSTELAKEKPDQPIEAVTESMRRGMEQPGLVKLYAALSTAAIEPAHRGHEYFAERYARVTERIMRGLERDQKAGRVRSDESAELMARLLVAVVEGMQKQWLMDPSIDSVAAVQAFLRLCGYEENSGADTETRDGPPAA